MYRIWNQTPSISLKAAPEALELDQGLLLPNPLFLSKFSPPSPVTICSIGENIQIAM